jgi:hypothetical protein
MMEEWLFVRDQYQISLLSGFSYVSADETSREGGGGYFVLDVLPLSMFDSVVSNI